MEKKILSDFELSKFVVCTDAGPSSATNRKFNNIGGRAFITTQPVKKLKKMLKDWALSPSGWRLSGDDSVEKKLYDISQLDESEHKESTFYKEQWINEDKLEQRLIVTFSIKYRDYQRRIRDGQIARTEKLIETNQTKNEKGKSERLQTLHCQSKRDRRRRSCRKRLLLY